MTIKGDRKLEMRINGTEARALELAAEHLNGEKLSARQRRNASAHLHRLAARYQLTDRVT